MRARSRPGLAAAGCVAAIVLAGASPYGAVAGETRSLAVLIPAEPDIYTQDYFRPPPVSEMHADAAYNRNDCAPR